MRGKHRGGQKGTRVKRGEKEEKCRREMRSEPGNGKTIKEDTSWDKEKRWKG